MLTNAEIRKKFDEYVSNCAAGSPFTTYSFFRKNDIKYPVARRIQTVLPNAIKKYIADDYGFTTVEVVSRSTVKQTPASHDYFPKGQHQTCFYWHKSQPQEQRKLFYNNLALKLTISKNERLRTSSMAKQTRKVQAPPKQVTNYDVDSERKAQELAKQLLATVRKQVIEELFDKMTGDK